MTAYAALLAASLVATSVFDHPLFAVIASFVLLIYGAVMHLFVYAQRRTRVPGSHRVSDDRRVVGQWALTAGLGLAAATLVLFLPALVIERSEPAIVALGLTLIWGAIYSSALVDWYYIHPRLAGLCGPAPCETTGNRRFVGLTNIWYGHRLAATVVASATLVGIPAVISVTTERDAVQNACSLAAVALTAVVLATQADYKAVITFLKNPRLAVGDIVLLIREQWGGVPQRVYVVDVAVEGAKVVRLADDGRPLSNATDDPVFEKADTTMLNEEIARCVHEDKGRAICRDGACTGVNWYCRNNALSSSRERSSAPRSH